jgi:hypothetical protein
MLSAWDFRRKALSEQERHLGARGQHVPHSARGMAGEGRDFEMLTYRVVSDRKPKRNPEILVICTAEKRESFSEERKVTGSLLHI